MPALKCSAFCAARSSSRRWEACTARYEDAHAGWAGGDCGAARRQEGGAGGDGQHDERAYDIHRGERVCDQGVAAARRARARAAHGASSAPHAKLDSRCIPPSAFRAPRTAQATAWLVLQVIMPSERALLTTKLVDAMLRRLRAWNWCSVLRKVAVWCLAYLVLLVGVVDGVAGSPAKAPASSEWAAHRGTRRPSSHSLVISNI